MPELGGFKVWIEVDGEALQEYQVQETKDNEIECHIASVPGRKFAVKVENNSPLADEKNCISAAGKVYLDGETLDSGLMFCHTPRYPSGEFRGMTTKRTISFSGVQRSLSTEQPFVFSQIGMLENGPNARPDEISAIGTIKLEINFWTIQGYDENFRGSSRTKADVLLSEKTKKGGGHCTSLGDTVASHGAHQLIANRRPDLPVYHFVFKHASRDWLQAKDIIERPILEYPDLQEQAVAGPSQVRERKRKVKNENGGYIQVIDLVSEEEYLDDDADREAYRKLREKIAKKRKISHPVKREPGGESTDTVIDISD